jgi:hypothetical protein
MAASVAATIGGAVGVDQGESGPVDRQQGPGRFGDPQQPDQEVIGLRHRCP